MLEGVENVGIGVSFFGVTIMSNMENIKKQIIKKKNCNPNLEKTSVLEKIIRGEHVIGPLGISDFLKINIQQY